MIEYLPYLTALGLGSMITVGVQAVLSRWAKNTDRRYVERKEAYIGLLEAWGRQENEGFTPASHLEVGHWLLRAKLVASRNTHEALDRWEEMEPGTPLRIQATKDLKEMMRKDLM